MRIIKLFLPFVFFIIVTMYLLYKYENIIEQKNQIDQIKFNFALLKSIDQNMSRSAALLLAGDIQRALITLEKDKVDIDKSLCESLHTDSIELLKKYDSNVSLLTIRQLVRYCKNN